MKEISIRTRFSEYRFQITGSDDCRGFLSGGRLGDQPHAAVLADTIPSTSREITDPPRLETGRRAVFYIDGEGFDLLTTSVITWITVTLVQSAAC